MEKRDKISIGNAGEYFVAGELERRGFTVAIPMSNVKDFDILIISRKCPEKQYAIQVKTTWYKQKKWTLNKKSETISRPNVFYVFVSLNENEQPEYHIVPSKIVAETIKHSHEEWLSQVGRKGQKHNDTSLRNFWDRDDKYKNKWEYLALE